MSPKHYIIICYLECVSYLMSFHSDHSDHHCDHCEMKTTKADWKPVGVWVFRRSNTGRFPNSVNALQTWSYAFVYF